MALARQRVGRLQARYQRAADEVTRQVLLEQIEAASEELKRLCLEVQAATNRDHN